MNKTLKAALVMATATALVAGGAGTIAYWRDEAAGAAGRITMGHLQIQPGESAWTIGGTAIDPATYRLVPGQTVDFAQTFEVDADDAMALEASVDWGNFTDSARPELHGPSYSVVGLTGTDVTPGDVSGTWKVTGATSELVVHAVLEVPQEMTGTEAATLDISGARVRLAMAEPDPEPTGEVGFACWTEKDSGAYFARVKLPHVLAHVGGADSQVRIVTEGPADSEFIFRAGDLASDGVLLSFSAAGSYTVLAIDADTSATLGPGWVIPVLQSGAVLCAPPIPTDYTLVTCTENLTDSVWYATVDMPLLYLRRDMLADQNTVIVISIDEVVVRSNGVGGGLAVDVTGLSDGPHTVTYRSEDGQTQYGSVQVTTDADGTHCPA